ncbi:MAG: asparagine synthase (glutamine-hydrolyzing), partial [Myxococcales bacterium]
RAGLAHARLSIIDLATGQQPLSNEDGTLWVVFNGEIFNYLELREELVARGHHFRTRSDTEVIVHAFEEWGEEAFARFNGQFAIALWNSQTNELVLARDPVGVRPLYLAEHAGRVIFASEVKAIFAAEPALSRELSPRGLAQTFTFWTVVAPQTAFASVRELPPGTLRRFGAKPRERAFFALDFEERFAGTAREAAEATRAALERATSLRILRADVPVGSYLSGGLDSSLVAALALRATGGRFHTFSLRVEDAEYDETADQREMGARLESEHHEVVVSRKDVARALPEVVAHTERPILRTAPVPLFLLSKLVHETGIKVVLTGEGADEMFAGYDLFREAKVRRFWGRQPASKARPMLLDRLYPWLSRSPLAARAMARRFFGESLESHAEPGFSHQPRWRSAHALQRLLANPAGRDEAAALLAALPAEFARWAPLAQDQYLEITTLLSGYLLSAQGDRMLMAHSVEGRFPYLDRDVVALACSLPARFKLRGLSEKQVLKDAARGLVPESILKRPKQPYRAPDALAFAGGDIPEWVEDAIGESAVRRAGVFDPAAVRKLWTKVRASPHAAQFSNADNMALIGVLSTQLLHAQFVERAPDASPVPPRTIIDRVGTINATQVSRCRRA